MIDRKSLSNAPSPPSSLPDRDDSTQAADALQERLPCPILASLPGELSEAIQGLTAARKRILETLLDPTYLGLSQKQLCQVAQVAVSTWWECNRDPAFQKLLASCREALYPAQKSALATMIIANALIPLDQAYVHAGEKTIGYQAQVLESQKMAAAMLGLQVKAGQVVEHRGAIDVLHQLQRQPTDVLEEFVETGSWPSRAGLPPWSNR